MAVAVTQARVKFCRYGMFLRPRPPQLPRPNTIWRRYKSNLPPLPPLEQWRKEFPISDSIGRIHLHKSKTADYLANKFIPRRRDGDGEGKIVIEAYPGEQSDSSNVML